MEDLQGGTLALEHRYEVGTRRGNVAYTTVYRGVQHPFDKPIWIKVYDRIGRVPEIYERIKIAAVRGSQLDGDGILRVIDFGDVMENVPFVISERVAGETLADYLERVQTLSPEQTVRLLRRLGAVLDRAHARGVVHGTLSPSWIYLPGEALDEAYVGHFQLGLTVDEIRKLEDEVMTYDAVFGLAPECFETHSNFTVEGDVYALAAIAYTALAGTHPYFDDVSDTSEGLLRIKTEEPRPLEEFGIDPRLAAVIDQGLSRDPSRRFASVAAFVAALDPREEKAAADVSADASHQELVTQTIANLPAEELSPTPLGTLLGLAVLVLLVSNVFWLYYVATSRPAPASVGQDVPPVARTVILPVGIQVQTQPPGATVFRVQPSGELELGTTPLLVDPKEETGKLDLLLRKHGFAETRLEVRPADHGRDVVIHLQEQP